MDNIHGKITDFFTTLDWNNLPENVKKEARRAVLDALGCLLAGLKTPLRKSLCQMAPLNKVSRGATMIGGSENLNPVFAAMANGYLCNALDADDGHRFSRLHSGGIIIPAALAALHDRDASGKKLIEAVVAGYEMAHRAGIASRESGLYYGSAYGGTYGAAAAAAWLMGLPPDTILNALGIAEMHAPNCLVMNWIESRKYPMVKEGMGWSAASGLMSACLAGNGVTGALTIFSGKEEFVNFDELGSSYETTRLYFKPYPGCRWTHPPVQALLALIKKHDIYSHDVTKVEIHTFENAVNLDSITPETIEEAQYSIPFVVGSALLDREFGPAQICEKRLSDPEIKTEAEKINLIVDNKFSKLYPEKLHAGVVVHTKDGKTYSYTNEAVWGDADHPLSDDDLEEKFLTLSQESVTPKQAKELIGMIWNLDRLLSVKKLIALLHKYALS